MTKNLKFEHIRIVVYIVSTILSILVSIGKIELPCYWKENFGFLCPACGLTRATISFMKLNLMQAFEYNAYYTGILLPLVLILVINDIYIIIKRHITKKENISFVEIMLGVKRFE